MAGWPQGRVLVLFLTPALALLASSCTPAPTVSEASSSPNPAASPEPNVFAVSGAQATQVDLVVRFVAAWNREDVGGALAVLTPDIQVSDCDYRTHEVVEAAGQSAVRSWLLARFSDHDRLEIGRIFNANPDSSSAAGVDWANRRSTTIAALGAPNGIRPELSAKVGFEESGSAIAGIANGPGGAPAAQITRICTVTAAPSASP